MVLQVWNPELASVLSEVESNPERCVEVLNGLSTLAAVELVGHLRSPAALSAAMSAKRSDVTRAARKRASMLGVRIGGAENSTHKAIASADPVAALSKLGDVDAATLEEWIDADPKVAVKALHAVLAETRSGTRGACVCAMLAKDVTLGKRVKPAVLTRALAEYDGPVTAAVVDAVERALADGWDEDLLEGAFHATTESGVRALVNASLRTRLVLGDVTADELKAEIGVSTGRSARLRGAMVAGAPTLYEVLLCVRDAELIPVAAELLEEITPVEDREALAARWFARDALGEEVRAHLLLQLGAQFAAELREGTLTERDVEFFIEGLANRGLTAGAKEVARVLCELTQLGDAREREVFGACLSRVPGAAIAMMEHAELGAVWMSEMVFERIFQRLGENAAAWRIVLGQLPTWNGVLDDLADAAARAVE